MNECDMARDLPLKQPSYIEIHTYIHLMQSFPDLGYSSETVSVVIVNCILNVVRILLCQKAMN